MFVFDLDDSGRDLTIKINRSKFDITCAGTFRGEVDKRWISSIRKVVIDFSAVDFIDSSGVGALVSLQKRLNPGTQPIEIKNPSAAVVTVIELLRLHRIFKLTHAQPPSDHAAGK